MSNLTVTVDPTSAKAPVLTAGDISPAVMMDFENTALDFFVAKSVPADKQVAMVVPGLKDIHICDWLAADHKHLIALPFPGFMKELRENYLHQDWEDQVHNNILMLTLAGANTTFWNWVQHLLKLNCLLQGRLLCLMTHHYAITLKLIWTMISKCVSNTVMLTRTRLSNPGLPLSASLTKLNLLRLNGSEI